MRQINIYNNQDKGCNHKLHFVLTLFTCGAWLPIWVLCWLIS